jgi:hypothetical protein
MPHAHILSSSLIGGGSMNTDKLSLNLDFTSGTMESSVKKGSIPDFARGSTGTFTGSNGLIQSASINVPRFDYDPISLECKGLLIEESRTNLILRSDNLANASWSKNNLTITSDTTTSPDGSQNADKLVESVILGPHFISQSITISSSSVYSVTVFAKASERTWLCVDPVNPSVANNATFFDLANGVIGTNASGNTASITNIGNGWYRCTISRTTSVSQTSMRLEIYPASANNTVSYLGVSSNGIFVWAAQIEAGSFPTNYIPTTSSTLARSADICSISGSSFAGIWNQSAGTLVEKFEASPNTNTTYVSASNGNIASNSVHFDNDTGNMRAVYYSGGSAVATLGLGSIGTIGTVNTIASAYADGDQSAARNGTLSGTTGTGALPIGISQMNIGADERSQSPTSFYTNKCIKSLKYYKKRLSNSKLQTLST